tara:strand:- start:97 stop:474 length:378 start_codon:yes stop_codon:yes gene_type:complete
MTSFNVNVIREEGRLSVTGMFINGTYTKTSSDLNGFWTYNNEKYPKLFIYKLRDNYLSLKEMYKDYSPLKLYGGHWVIGCIEGRGSSSTSVWAYSDKKQKGDSLDCSELEWFEMVDLNKIKVTLL